MVAVDEYSGGLYRGSNPCSCSRDEGKDETQRARVDNVPNKREELRFVGFERGGDIFSNFVRGMQ
jgi:hypothetical protein